MALNPQNLIPLNKKSPEEAKAIRSAGGKARAKQKKERSTFKKLFDDVLNDRPNNSEFTYKELITKAMIKEAIKGRVNAVEFIRDTIGEKPIDKIEFNDVSDIANEVEDFFTK